MLELRKVADRSGDPVDTVWRHANGQDVQITKTAAKALNDASEDAGLEPPLREVDVWPLSHVEVIGDPPEEHNFADGFVARGMVEGWVRLDNMRLGPTEGYERGPVLTGDAVVIDTADGPLTYEIVEHPGRYPDKSEDSGFRVTHEYKCRLAGGGR